MPGLKEVRRFVNYSNKEQRVYNSKQASYETVYPKSHIQGEQYGPEVSNPNFRETTAHLTQQEFYERLPQEKDVEFLRRLAMIEANEFTPRPSVVKLIEERIKRIVKGDADNSSPDSGQGQKAAGA